MKVYFAGANRDVKRVEYLKEFGASKLMLTFAEAKQYTKRKMKYFRDKGFDFLMDSGAFSMWNRGIHIDISAYCDFLVSAGIPNYIVLDKIGDHTETMRNQTLMESHGLSPIPVFHLGSPIEALVEICGRYPYVCLGGTVRANYHKRMRFFTECFSLFPKHRFHGLGLTDLRIVKAFNFYSVDSTAWLMASKSGKVFNDEGKKVEAVRMTEKERFENTIRYYVAMESLPAPT